MTGMVQYSYSSARVKAMESALIDGSTMQHIIDSKDVPSILSILVQTSFKDYLSRYGGMQIKRDLIDFALSRNLADSVSKLVSIVPTTQRKAIRAIIGKWDMYDIRLAIEAKDRGKSYDQIAMYVVDTPVYGEQSLKEAMRESTVEGMLSRLAINSPYAQVIKDASTAYSKNHNAFDGVSALDIGYYDSMSGVIQEIANAHYHSALIVKSDIDMKNVVTLIRAKRLGLRFQQIEGYLIGNGTMDKRALEQLFTQPQNLEEMVLQVKAFDLKEALSVYKETNQLLSFEIAMHNSILNRALRILKPAILSFGTIMAYIYLKELEVYTIRISINSKIYGLTSEEVSRLITWKR